MMDMSSLAGHMATIYYNISQFPGPKLPIWAQKIGAKYKFSLKAIRKCYKSGEIYGLTCHDGHFNLSR